MLEIIFKIRYFERGLSKSVKKVNFIFSFKPRYFYWEKLSKTKGGLELVTCCSSGCETSSKIISLFVIYYLTKFDEVM